MGVLRSVVLVIRAECNHHHALLGQSFSRSWGSRHPWGTSAAQPASLLNHFLSQHHEDEQDQRSQCLQIDSLPGPAQAQQHALSRAHALLQCGRTAPPPGLLASALLTSCVSYGDSLPSLTTVRHVSFIRTLSVSWACISLHLISMSVCGCTCCVASAAGEWLSSSGDEGKQGPGVESRCCHEQAARQRMQAACTFVALLCACSVNKDPVSFHRLDGCQQSARSRSAQQSGIRISLS